jgi:hypothetical protein
LKEVLLFGVAVTLTWVPACHDVVPLGSTLPAQDGEAEVVKV